MGADAAAWDAWLDSIGRPHLERFLQEGYLARQRWFGSKAQTIQSVQLTDHAWLPAERSCLLLATIEVVFVAGGSESYVILLSLVPGSAAPGDVSVLLRFPAAPAAGERAVLEAVEDAEATRALLRFLAEQQSRSTAQGQVTSELLLSLEKGIDQWPIVRSQAEQSNTNLKIGDRYVLKLFRRVTPGLNPDYEIGRFLLEKTQFRNIPPLAGAILYQHHHEEPMVLAMLQGWVKNDGDGWELALDRVQEFLNQSAARSASKDERAALAGAAAGWLSDAALLGQRTAELHLALASSRDDPAFRPEALTGKDLQALGLRMCENLNQGLSLLSQRHASLPVSSRGLARSVLGKRGALEQKIKLPHVQPLPQKIRCHGDYHLGQVLHAGNDFVILDFEGEPSRPLTERRAKQSPLKDVAGMLRSFSYAAEAGWQRHLEKQPANGGRLEPTLQMLESNVRSAFLASYRRTAAAAGFLPSDGAQFQALLDLFILDKALYELTYELNNRPDWVGIPLRGIEGLVK